MDEWSRTIGSRRTSPVQETVASHCGIHLVPVHELLKRATNVENVVVLPARFGGQRVQQFLSGLSEVGNADVGFCQLK